MEEEQFKSGLPSAQGSPFKTKNFNKFFFGIIIIATILLLGLFLLFFFAGNKKADRGAPNSSLDRGASMTAKEVA